MSSCQQHRWLSSPSCSPGWATQCIFLVPEQSKEEERGKTAPTSSQYHPLSPADAQPHHPWLHPGPQLEAEARDPTLWQRPFLCGATCPFLMFPRTGVVISINYPKKEVPLECPNPNTHPSPLHDPSGLSLLSRSSLPRNIC